MHKEHSTEITLNKDLQKFLEDVKTGKISTSEDFEPLIEAISNDTVDSKEVAALIWTLLENNFTHEFLQVISAYFGKHEKADLAEAISKLADTLNISHIQKLINVLHNNIENLLHETNENELGFIVSEILLRKLKTLKDPVLAEILTEDAKFKVGFIIKHRSLQVKYELIYAIRKNGKETDSNTEFFETIIRTNLTLSGILTNDLIVLNKASNAICLRLLMTTPSWSTIDFINAMTDLFKFLDNTSSITSTHEAFYTSIFAPLIADYIILQAPKGCRKHELFEKTNDFLKSANGFRVNIIKIIPRTSDSYISLHALYISWISELNNNITEVLHRETPGQNDILGVCTQLLAQSFKMLSELENYQNDNFSAAVKVLQDNYTIILSYICLHKSVLIKTLMAAEYSIDSTSFIMLFHHMSESIDRFGTRYLERINLVMSEIYANNKKSTPEKTLSNFKKRTEKLYLEEVSNMIGKYADIKDILIILRKQAKIFLFPHKTCKSKDIFNSKSSATKLNIDNVLQAAHAFVAKIELNILTTKHAALEKSHDNLKKESQTLKSDLKQLRKPESKPENDKTSSSNSQNAGSQVKTLSQSLKEKTEALESLQDKIKILELNHGKVISQKDKKIHELTESQKNVLEEVSRLKRHLSEEKTKNNLLSDGYDKSLKSHKLLTERVSILTHENEALSESKRNLVADLENNEKKLQQLSSKIDELTFKMTGLTSNNADMSAREKRLLKRSATLDKQNQELTQSNREIKLNFDTIQSELARIVSHFSWTDHTQRTQLEGLNQSLQALANANYAQSIQIFGFLNNPPKEVTQLPESAVIFTSSPKDDEKSADLQY